MADRIGVIRQGELILTEDKHSLMQQLGTRQLTLQLQQPLSAVPDGLAGYPLTLEEQGYALVYTFDAKAEQSGIAELLRSVDQLGIEVRDLRSSQSSLEDIFVGLVHSREQSESAASLGGAA